MIKALIVLFVLAGVVVFVFACGITAVYLFCMAIINAIFDSFE